METGVRKRLRLFATAAMTRGCRCPVLSTAMPAAKSMKRRPSTSQISEFSAFAT